MQKIIVIAIIYVLSSCSLVDENIVVNETTTNTQTHLPDIQNTQQTHTKNQKKYNNLWQEISDNLTLYQYKDKDIFWHLKWFKDNPRYLTRVSKRAKTYLKIVLDEVKKQGLPYELALLPIVESAYYPFAYSHGTASGMWQFIPSTGKLYGLKQNFWIDERRDPIRSTKAALSYLKSLHKFFKGNWYHAIASYNSGPGRVKKAIEKNKRLGKPTDFWNLKLPAETVGYVPRLLAVAEIFKNPEKYNQNIIPVTDNKVVGEVLLKSQLDLAVASQWSGLSIEEIYKLNAGLNQWATPNARYHLILPIEKVNSFRKKLNNYPKNKRIKWVRHKVKRGDSILSLAKKYNTSPQTIKEVNKLKSHKIVLGKYLIIPIAGKNSEYYTLSKEQRAESRESKTGKKVIHIVKKGDSLWGISMKYKVSVKQIIKWNHLPSRTIINKGDRLVIWQKNKLNSTRLLETMQTNNNTHKTITYTIKKGDNLSTIAHKFKVNIVDIKEKNKLTSNTLSIGKKLKIIKEIKNN